MREKIYASLARGLALMIQSNQGNKAFGATGPSSSQSPYVTPTAPGVEVTSILTVGDSVGNYTMVGIPDGLGAYDNGDVHSPF